MYSLVRVGGSSATVTPAIKRRIDVENEISARLSRDGVAPVFFGRFENGRVEEFYNGSSTLHWNQMGATEEQIATPRTRLSYAYSLAEGFAMFHKLEYEDGVCLTDRGSPAQTWGQTAAWIELADDYVTNKPGCGEKVEQVLQPYGGYQKVREEWEWLKSYLSPSSTLVAQSEGVKFSRENIFTHHDLQPLNILKNEEWGEYIVKFIDFEYAGHNPRSLDIANTWCEHTTMTDFTQDYDKEYPNPAQKNFFVVCYLEHLDPAGINGGKFSDEFVADFITDIDRHALLSHYLWLMWSVRQAIDADIEWDYYRYIGVRAEGYYWMKKQLGL